MLSVMSDAQLTPTASPTPEPTAPQPAHAPNGPNSGFAVAALILGIVAVVVAFVPFLNFITWLLAILALVFGIIALVQKGRPKGLATVGTALGGIGLILGIAIPILYAGVFFATVNTAVDEGGIVTVPVPVEEGEGAEEPTTDGEEPSSGLGSREDPKPIGSTIELDFFGDVYWQITPGAPTLDANQIIAAENEFNEPPAEGSQYVLLPLDVTYVGSESGTPWVDTRVVFVGSDGNTYNQAFAVAPSPLTDVGEMFTGANAQGNLVFEVPSDVIEGGTWSISLLFGDPIYVAAH